VVSLFDGAQGTDCDGGIDGVVSQRRSQVRVLEGDSTSMKATYAVAPRAALTAIDQPEIFAKVLRVITGADRRNGARD